MLDLWNNLCIEKLHKTMEVMICNRRDHSTFSSYKGQVNIACHALAGENPSCFVFGELQQYLIS
jgi:hypothetical protein